MNETICASCDEGKLNGLLKDSEVRFAFDKLINVIISSKEEYKK